MQNIISQLKQYGLDENEAEIYLYLLKNGERTALSLSKELHRGRTQVYRLLDVLYEKHLVYQRLESRGLIFGAYSSSRLELLLAEKESDIQALRSQSEALFKHIDALSPTFTRNTQIRYHTGVKGLEQVTWNSTKAKNTLRIYEKEQDMSAFIEAHTAERIREEFVKNSVHIKQLTNKKHIQNHTQVTDLIQLWEPRFLSPKKLKIEYEVLVYNNVYTMYHFVGNDVFCVELYDDKLASMQTQLFDLIWANAKKMKKTSGFGDATI